MKISFVSQPIDPVIPPIQNSIGIIIYEIAKRIGINNDVTIFMNKKFNNRKIQTKNNIRFIPINTFADKFVNKIFLKLSKLRNKKLLPYYASIFHYSVYSIQIAIKIKKLETDIVHIVNFSQFIPIIRFFNPKVKIVIHMECEWLTQLDYKIIKKRIDKVDHIVGCSNFITKKISEKYYLNSKKCSTIYNGVDIDIFKPIKLARKNRKKCKKILFVGRVSPEKGVHILLKTLVNISYKVPDISCEIIGPIVSAPPEYIVSISDDPRVHGLSSLFNNNYYIALKKRISKKLIERVKFKNNIPHRELVQKYCDSDVFVFPSVWHEPFGIPVIEAMACEIPVVATKSGGITELIEDCKTGILVNRGETDALGDAILRIIGDKALSLTMGKAGRKRVFEKFTWEKIANDFINLYRKLSTQ